MQTKILRGDAQKAAETIAKAPWNRVRTVEIIVAPVAGGSDRLEHVGVMFVTEAKGENGTLSIDLL